MKIAEASIFLGAEHLKQEQYKKAEALTVWKTGQEPSVIEAGDDHPGASINVSSVIAEFETDSVKISAEAIGKARRITGIAENVVAEEKAVVDLNIMILKAFIERITGKVIDLKEPGDIYKNKGEPVSNQTNVPEVAVEDTTPNEESAGYGIVYEFHESYQEYERMDFSANGIIRTEDGKEIIFDTKLTMTRAFVEENHLTIRAGDALKDPLVINFDGKSTEMSDQEFNFDIDSDGKEDQLHFLASGSGFLALDLNQDGVINNGSELFGAQTGNGFSELSQYDNDNNGWIDENDQIYNSLRIWHLDDSGEKKLVALGEKGIGAIYLGHVSTPFSIKDENNDLQAEVRSTGLFVKENGSTGTIQQIDMVV